MEAPPSRDSSSSARCGQQPGFCEVWPTFVQFVGEDIVIPVCPGCGTGQPFT